jgi:hypothetical protein
MNEYPQDEHLEDVDITQPLTAANFEQTLARYPIGEWIDMLSQWHYICALHASV